MSLIIRLEHVLTVPGFHARRGFCRGGTRRWCQQHGIDWNQLRKHGLPADVVLAAGDPMADAVVRHAEQMEAARGR